MGEWDFYRDSMVFDYCLLLVIDFNIMCLKIFFPPYIFFLLFCSFASTCICFSFSFLFFLIFSFFFLQIFSNFLVLSFNSHKLFFLNLSIRIIKPESNHFGIKLYLSVCCIPLSFASMCISFFFFFCLSFPFVCGYFQTFHSNTNSF